VYPVGFLRGEVWHYWYDVGMNKTEEGRGVEEEFQGRPWQVVEGELFGQPSVVMAVY